MHSVLLGLTDCIISLQQIGLKEDTRWHDRKPFYLILCVEVTVFGWLAFVITYGHKELAVSSGN